MGRVWGGDPIPHPRPTPIPATNGGTFFPSSLPYRVLPGTCPVQYEFFYFLGKLHEKKKKKLISMTTIDLLTNQFTSINLHETTIHACIFKKIIISYNIMTKCFKIPLLIFQNNINNFIIYLPASIYMKI